MCLPKNNTPGNTLIAHCSATEIDSQWLSALEPINADIAQLYASPSTFEELFATFDLSPIKIETPSVSLSEIETVALKRKKNTEAARRSRSKKVAKMENLETTVKTLETEKSDLLIRVAVLENEKSSFLARELEFNRRIKDLEDQLAESHKTMLAILPPILPSH